MHLPGKCRSFHNNLMHRFCFIVAFVLSLRVGEATNPGPDNTWTLGVVNPTGIGGKGYQCSKLSSGVFGVSESHLTRPGLNRFRQELRSCSSSFSYLAGRPAPFKQRGIGCIGGKNTGVGFLSTVPSRALDCEWNQELFETSRVQAASFYTGSSWILGGVVYGYASKVDTTDIRTLTNDLLSELCNHIKPEQHGLKFMWRLQSITECSPSSSLFAGSRMGRRSGSCISSLEHCTIAHMFPLYSKRLFASLTGLTRIRSFSFEPV